MNKFQKRPIKCLYVILRGPYHGVYDPWGEACTALTIFGCNTIGSENYNAIKQLMKTRQWTDENMMILGLAPSTLVHASTIAQ